MLRYLLNNVRYVALAMIKHSEKILVNVLYKLNLYEEERNGDLIKPYFTSLASVKRNELNQLKFIDQVGTYGVIVLFGAVGIYLALEVIATMVRWPLKLIAPKKTFRDGKRVFQYRVDCDLAEQQNKWKEEDRKLLQAQIKEKQEKERALNLHKESIAKKRKEYELKKQDESLKYKQLIIKSAPMNKLKTDILKLIQDMESSKDIIKTIRITFKKLKHNDLEKFRHNIVGIQEFWLQDKIDRQKKLKDKEEDELVETNSQKCQNNIKENGFIFDEKSSRELKQCYDENLIFLPGRFIGKRYIVQTNKIEPGTLGSLLKKEKNLLKILPILQEKFNLVSRKLYSPKELTQEESQELYAELKKIAEKYDDRLESLTKLNDVLIDLKNKAYSNYSKFENIQLESHQKFNKNKLDAERRKRITKSERLSKMQQKRLQQKNERLSNLDNIQKRILNLRNSELSNLSSDQNEVTIKKENLQTSVKENKYIHENITVKMHRFANSFNILNAHVGKKSLTLDKDKALKKGTRSAPYLAENCGKETKLNLDYPARNLRFVEAINEVEIYLKEMQIILESLDLLNKEELGCITSCSSEAFSKHDNQTILNTKEALAKYSVSLEYKIFWGKVEIYCLIYITSSIMEKIRKGPLRSIFPEHIPHQFRNAIYHNPSFRKSFEVGEDLENISNVESKEKREQDKNNEFKLEILKQYQDKMRHLSLELLTFLRKFFNYRSSGQDMQLDVAKLSSLILSGQDHQLFKRGHIKNSTKICKIKMRESITFLNEMDSKVFAKKYLVGNLLQSVGFATPLQSLVISYVDEFTFSNEKSNGISIMLKGAYALAVSELGAYFKEYCHNCREANNSRRDRDFPIFKKAIEKYDPELINKIRHAEIPLKELLPAMEAASLLKGKAVKTDRTQLVWLAKKGKKSSESDMDPAFTQYNPNPV